MKVISFSRTINLDIFYGEGLKTALILNAGQKYILQDTYVKGLQDKYPYYHDHLRELSDPAAYLRRDFDWMQGPHRVCWSLGATDSTAIWESPPSYIQKSGDVPKNTAPDAEPYLR